MDEPKAFYLFYFFYTTTLSVILCRNEKILTYQSVCISIKTEGLSYIQMTISTG